MLQAEFALILFYYEVLFGFSVFGSEFASSLPSVILSSLYIGIPVCLLLMVLRGKVRIVSEIAVRVLGALPFLIEFFIYMQFKTLYDIHTVFFGGGDALTGFASTIRGLILSVSGIGHILLFLLPILIFVLRLVTGHFKPAPVDRWKVGLLALIIPMAFFVNVAIIASDEALASVHDREYNFPAASSKFGLSEALALDIRGLMRSDDELMFQAVEVPLTSLPTATPAPTASPVPTVPGATSAPTATPSPSPYPHVMDIDFEAIAEEETGTIASLAAYCASLEPSMSNEYTGLFEGKNLIMITAEAFTAEAIDPVLTPTLYRLATRGINFTDSYIPATAGTIGGEFSHVFGLLPEDGGVSFYHMTTRGNTYLTMSQRLNALGYYGAAFHNNDYQFYTRNVTHNLLGFSEGFTGWGNGLESYIDPVWPESDLQLMEATVPGYIDQQPFCIYYMSVSGHSNYSRGANAMSRLHWDETASIEGMYSDTVRAYIACQIELDRALEYLLDELETAGIMNDTVIAICADHYPYGLDRDSSAGYMHYLSELYGYEVTNTVERDHNRLILWCGCLEDEDPIVIDTPTSSLDMLPTLLNLFGIEYDSRLLPGRDVLSDAMPLMFNASYDWKTDLGTYISSRAQFTPSDPSVEIPEGYVEAVRAIVSNRINFCRGVLSSNFYRYLFGDPNGDLTAEVIAREPVRVYDEAQPEGTSVSASSSSPETEPVSTEIVETAATDIVPEEITPVDTVPSDIAPVQTEPGQIAEASEGGN
ncbi:MAG: sulfatase-like hydrolase/transferase [Clostridiales bacterium]|nr:sulfatase-like hydrolase/transferase [Clostridiales bacterium]